MDEERKKNHIEEYRQIKMRRQRGRSFLLFVLLFLLLLFSLFLILKIIQRQKPVPRYLFLTEEELAFELETEALIARDETVYASPATGLFRSFMPQGAKVPKNALLGQIVPPGREEAMRQLQKADNDVIDRRYELIEAGKGAEAERLFEDSRESVQRNLHILYERLMQNDNSKTAEIEADLKLIIGQRTEDVKLFNFADEELERLISYQNSLEQAAAAYIKPVSAEASGIFIRYWDGMEELLNRETVMEMSAGEVEGFLKKASPGQRKIIEEAAEGKALYKLTRSIDQYFIMLLPSGFLSQEDVNSRLRLYSPANGVSLNNCYLLRAEETRRGTLIVVRSSTGLEAFSSLRKAPVRLYLRERVGLRVPRSALLDYQEGNTEAAIMIVHDGYFRRCPVRLGEMNRDYVLVSETEDSLYAVQVSTMVVVNPAAVQEDAAMADAG